MVIGIPGAYYFWKLGRDPLIFLEDFGSDWSFLYLLI